MATSPTMQMPGQTPAGMPAPQQGAELPPDPSPSSPQTKDEQAILDEFGLTQRDRDNLMMIRSMAKEKRSQPRRIWTRNTLRIFEYLKGNQYYVVGPDGFTFQDPFAADAGGTGTQQGNDQEIYHYVTNIIQWFERVLVSTLGSTVPAMRFQPDNAQSDLGNRVAQQASRANAYIERLNDEKALLAQKISYLALAGAYFVYTRPVRDERLSGDRMEQVTDEAMEMRQVAPARYICPQCGASTPLDQFAVESKMLCKNCGAPVSAKDFFGPQSLPMPVIKQAREVPQMQVRKSLYNGLHVDADFTADSETGDPLVKVTTLDLSLETDIGAMRAMFPNLWDKFAGDGDSSDGETDTDRIARMQIPNPTSGQAWWSKNSGILTQGQMPTYSRTWLQPESFNTLPTKAEADRLLAIFPTGCCVSSWNGNFLSVRKAKLTEEWTWCGTRRGFGLYPPAILSPAMDFQDRINDAGNTEAEYYDRMAVPGVAYDATAINGKGLAGKYWAVGSWFPLRVKPKEGRTLQNSVWQPTFHMDKGIENYGQRILLLAQMIVGITPQMWGGGQTHIDTKGGQEQALKVATGIVWQYWSAIREESARTAKNAIRCLALNATQQVFDVIKGDDNQFRNEPIDLNSLKNEIDAYPEEEQGYPESRDQMAQRFQELILGAPKNPLIMEMLEPMKNRRMAVRTILPQDMEIPEEKNRIKTLEDIALLMQGVPQPSINPMTGQPMMLPSVQPDKDIDDLAITQQTVKEYVTENYRELKDQKPMQFENILAYLRLAAQFEREQQLMNAPPMPPQGAPGPQQQQAA